MANKTEIVCGICNRSFMVWPSGINRKYCSRKCSDEARKRISERQKRNSVLIKLNHNPLFHKKRLAKCREKPSKAEKKLISLFEEYSLPYIIQYVEYIRLERFPIQGTEVSSIKFISYLKRKLLICVVVRNIYRGSVYT